VNRADFIPNTIWVDREDGWMVPVHRDEDPERWLNLVESGDPIVTQVDDGELEDGKGVVATSSSSALVAMKTMLDMLDAKESMKVLEIGAGTGYNAALIAEKVAPGHVTTIEVDREIAEHARTVLPRTGLPVTVVTGDGTLGHPDNAPYDRIMVTASALRVPYAWVEQTRPGGRIVLPFVGSFGRGAFACLTVDGDGAAPGRFHGGASFMRLRNQRNDRVLWRWWDAEDIQVTTTRMYPEEPFVEFEAAFALGLRLPGWVTGHRQEDGGAILMMSHLPSGSWATVTPSKRASGSGCGYPAR
jgi:protein-L-isoaspartate O-methyltransferase